MALIKCKECVRDVSDKAVACPHCGAPIPNASQKFGAAGKVSFDGGSFRASKALLTRHAVKAIQSLNYKVDSLDEVSGLIAFTTGMTWGSWSGVSGSIYLEEIEPQKFEVTGSAKQNVNRGQMLAFDIGGESKKKVKKVIEEMRRLAE